MRTRLGWFGLLPLLVALTAHAGQSWTALRQQLGSLPALVVVVCEGDSEDVTAIEGMIDQTPWKICCQVPAGRGGALRDWARQAGVLGNRLSVIDASTASLWLAGDMADGVWVTAHVSDPPSRGEVLRVLHAGGLALTPAGTYTKPARADVGQWRHPYHGPDNNVVSEDRVARLPGELRFQTHPTFAAMPNQSLLAGGRIYFFTGHIAFHEREEPLLNRLTVLNAYHGLTLWSRPLDPRFVVHNLAKVATESEILYAEGGSLLVLDGATGKQLGKHPVPDEAAAAGDTDWKWLAQQDGVLWAAFGPPDGRVTPHRQRRRMGHWPWQVANDQYRVIVENFGAARTLAAFRYPEMKLLWSITEPETFDVRALCMEGGRILQLAPEKYIAARDAATGKQLWRHTPEAGSTALAAIGAALRRQGWGLGWATFCCARAHGGVICVAGPPFKKSVAVDFDTGELLWSTDNESPHPFFLNDSLYIMPRVAHPSALCRRVDPATGRTLDEFNLGVIGSCTRLTVTPTQFYYRPGGGEGRTVYFDISARELAHYEGVVRPGCFDGAVPANGRLYWMPLACDCWQVHGTFSMAPRQPLGQLPDVNSLPPWESPSEPVPAAQSDWTMLRADAQGSATVPVRVPRQVKQIWSRLLGDRHLPPPIGIGERVYVGSADGLVHAMEAADGKVLWTATARAAVVQPPIYWQGRVLFGAADGYLYCVDAVTGQLLGRRQIALEHRLINVMDRLVSAWALGGGVVVDEHGTAYTAAGTTATDGTVVAALDVKTGQFRWRQPYTLDRPGEPLSFGVQSNLLLHDDQLLVNGGAPVGIVALDRANGENAHVVAKLDAGKEMFLEPDGRPFCAGPELYSDQWTRTTIFKRHQGRAYFSVADRQVALVDGRLFAARDSRTLDAIVNKMNSDPETGGERVVSQPWDVMKVPVPASLEWASDHADIRGLAVGSDGLIVLHENEVEALSPGGQRLWQVDLPAAPVRWGIALTEAGCVVTLADGRVLFLASN